VVATKPAFFDDHRFGLLICQRFRRNGDGERRLGGGAFRPLLASNASSTMLRWSWLRKQQLVRLALVVPFGVIMFAEALQGAA
jgi:hypothetical protein